MKRNKVLLLVSSLATLAVLAIAAWDENVAREWRRLQGAYASLAPGGSPVMLRQVVAPKTSAMDRCVSCHVGMAPGETPIAGHRVFGKHPDVVHDPNDFGCVVCHAGQGRATDLDDAHGTAEFWPTPMIPRKFAYAGCGTCHTSVRVPNLVALERGRAIFERADCLACHAVDGRGGTLRPLAATAPAGGDLSRVGARGYDRAWYAKHLAKLEGFGAIAPEDLDAIAVFLDSRVGAPGLVEAKATFHTLGCRGCHKIGGVGGDDGPDLTRVGEKDPGRIDFRRVGDGTRSLEAFFSEHFRSPAAVVPGSAMPTLGLSDTEIERLDYYLFSLRRAELPEALWPMDRVRTERMGEREFATDGATLYGTFCAACHGRSGQGMRYPGASAFPAIANPDFLRVASDAFVRATVTHGRPGRRMPAWGPGGLRPEEIDAVVAHLRELGGTAFEPDARAARWARGDAAAGSALFASACASCHGEKGEGKEGPALRNPVLLENATDTYLYETIRNGRRGTSMEGFSRASTTHRELSDAEIESVIAFVRRWEVKR
jgi:cbb3-type cytochrome c oxidase subunit III